MIQADDPVIVVFRLEDIQIFRRQPERSFRRIDYGEVIEQIARVRGGLRAAPSTVSSLLRSRMPPNDTRVTSNSVFVDCKLVRPVATPGVNSTKSVNRRPLIGKDEIWRVSMT